MKGRLLSNSGDFLKPYPPSDGNLRAEEVDRMSTLASETEKQDSKPPHLVYKEGSDAIPVHWVLADKRPESSPQSPEPE